MRPIANFANRNQFQIFPSYDVLPTRTLPSGPILTRNPAEPLYPVQVPVTYSANAIDINPRKFETNPARLKETYRLNPFVPNEDDDEEEPLQRAEEL